MAIYTSANGGSTWDEVTYSGTPIENLKEVMVTKDGSSVNLLGDNGIFSLTDIIAQAQIDAPLSNFQNKKVGGYVFAINKEQVIYKVSTDTGVAYSVNITGNYKGVFTNVKSSIDGNFIVTTCYNLDDTELYVYSSINGGNDWDQYTISGITSSPTTDILFSDTGDYCFIRYGTQNTFLRRNIVGNWAAISIGATLFADSMCISETGEIVYIGAFNTVAGTKHLYISSNYGDTFTSFTPYTSLSSSYRITKMACSKDGEHLSFVISLANDYYNYYYNRTGAYLSWRSDTEASTNGVDLIYDNSEKNYELISTGTNSTTFTSMAMSTTGQYIIACTTYQLYTSDDYGATWHKRYESVVPFINVDIAKDYPSRMVATAAGYYNSTYYGYLLVSTNYGLDWEDRWFENNTAYLNLRVSLNGNGSLGYFSAYSTRWTSTDLFINGTGVRTATYYIIHTLTEDKAYLFGWGYVMVGGLIGYPSNTPRKIIVLPYGGVAAERCLAQVYLDIKTNYNGNKAIACTASTIYTSSDLFVSYLTIILSGKTLKGVSCDRTGSYMSAFETNGQVWISTNGGTSFEAKLTTVRNWTSVVFEGQYVIASNDAGEIWKSEDLGNTWFTTYEKYDNARLVSMNGLYIAVCEKSGNIRIKEAGSDWQDLSLTSSYWVDLKLSSFGSYYRGMGFTSDNYFCQFYKNQYGTNWIETGTFSYIPQVSGTLYSGDYSITNNPYIIGIVGGNNICIYYYNNSWTAMGPAQNFIDPHTITPQYRAVAINNNKVLACSSVGTSRTIYPGSGGTPYTVDDGGYLIFGSYNGTTYTWTTNPSGVSKATNWADVAISGDGTTWFACKTNGTIYINKNGSLTTINKPQWTINSISTNYTGNAVIIGTSNEASYYQIGIYNSSLNSWSWYEQTGLEKQILESEFYTKHFAAISDDKLKVLTEKYFMTTTDETSFVPTGSNCYLRYSNIIKKYNDKFNNVLATNTVPTTITNLSYDNSNFYYYINNMIYKSANLSNWSGKGTNTTISSLGTSQMNRYYLGTSDSKYITCYNEPNNTFNVLTPKGNDIYGDTTSKMCMNDDGSIIYIYDDYGYLYKSIDGGLSFTNVKYIMDTSNGSPLGAAFSLKCNENGTIIALTLTGASGYKYLYLSLNSGISFSKIITPPEAISVPYVSINKVGNALFIIGNVPLVGDVVYFSNNYGSSWAQVDTAFSAGTLKDIAVAEAYVFVSVYGGAVYKSANMASLGLGWSPWVEVVGLGTANWLKILTDRTGSTVIAFETPQIGGTLINVSGNDTLSYITEDSVNAGTYYSRVYSYPGWGLVNEETSTISKPISFVNYIGTKYYSALFPIETGKKFGVGPTSVQIKEINTGLNNISDLSYMNDDNVYYSTYNDGAIYNSTLKDLTNYKTGLETAWTAAAISPDGKNIIAASYGFRNLLYVSYDYGKTYEIPNYSDWFDKIAITNDYGIMSVDTHLWTATTDSNNKYVWADEGSIFGSFNAVSIDESGRFMIGVLALGDILYWSTDYGVNFSSYLESYASPFTGPLLDVKIKTNSNTVAFVVCSATKVWKWVHNKALVGPGPAYVSEITGTLSEANISKIDFDFITDSGFDIIVTAATDDGEIFVNQSGVWSAISSHPAFDTIKRIAIKYDSPSFEIFTIVNDGVYIVTNNGATCKQITYGDSNYAHEWSTGAISYDFSIGVASNDELYESSNLFILKRNDSVNSYSGENTTLKTIYTNNLFKTEDDDDTWKFITVNNVEAINDEHNVKTPLPLSEYFWNQTVEEAPGHYFESDETKRILSAISKSPTINNEFKHYIINCYKNNEKIGNNKNGYFIIHDDGRLDVFIPNIEIFCINEGRSTLNILEVTAYFGEAEKELPYKFINKKDMVFNLSSTYCIPSISYYDENTIKLKVESDKQCKDLCSIRISGKWK